MNNINEKSVLKKEPEEYGLKVKEELHCNYSINAWDIKEEIKEEEHSQAADVYAFDFSLSKQDTQINSINNEEYGLNVKEELLCDNSIVVSERKDDEIKEEEHSPAPNVHPLDTSSIKQDTKINEYFINKIEEFLCVEINENPGQAEDESLSRKDKAEHKYLKSYQCNTCLRSFSNRSKIKKHLTMHTDISNLTPSAFTCSSPLKRNLRTTTGDKLFKCSICPSVFQNSSTLKKHLRIHTGEKPFKCNICLSTFSASCSLKKHLRIHTGEKPFKCNICPSAFIESGALKKHLLTHTGEKPFKCSICPSAFSDSSTLKQHLRRHSGEKPFKCNICLSAFSVSCSLKKHLRTHTGEKPFKCSICPSAFTESSTLKKHLITHTGEKPYKCSICPSTFTQSSSFKRHLSKHRFKTV